MNTKNMLPKMVTSTAYRRTNAFAIADIWPKKKTVNNLLVDSGKSVSFQEFATAVSEYLEKQKHGSVAAPITAETRAFTTHINNVLGGDKDLPFLPMKTESHQLYEHISDGLLMAKMINKAQAHTIDERALNKSKKGKNLNPYQMGENQRLVISSAKAIGCVVVNIHTADLIAGKPKQTLALVWQIVRMQLMAGINLKNHPEIYRLLEDGEDLMDLMALPPEDILIRWVNYHMKEAGNPRRLKKKTFTKEIKDSEIYTVLLNQIAPDHCDKKALGVKNTTKRAEHVLRNASNLPAKTGKEKLLPLLDAGAIAKGNKRLNYAFLAQIFNHNPGLEPDEDFDAAGLMEDGEGTREERVFRMWMNSLLGPDGYYINSLYQDLRSGLHLLRVEDKIQPGIVPWKKVQKRAKTRFAQTLNCDVAVQVAKDLDLEIVGIGGADIYNRIVTLILGIVWQLLREYTINLLTKLGKGAKIADKDIIKWANKKVSSSGGERQIKSFRQKELSNSLFLLDLMRAIEPRAINDELITAGVTEEEKAQNARYTLSVARKFGAVVFITYEDIVEVKPKMVMLLLAACMAFDKGFRDASDMSQEATTKDAIDRAASKARSGGKKKGKKLGGKKKGKRKFGKKKGTPSLNRAMLGMEINKGDKKLHKVKKSSNDSALASAKVTMEIAKGGKKLKHKSSPSPGLKDTALASAKVNMEIAKGTNLKHVDGTNKPNIPEWATEDFKKSASE